MTEAQGKNPSDDQCGNRRISISRSRTMSHWCIAQRAGSVSAIAPLATA